MFVALATASLTLGFMSVRISNNTFSLSVYAGDQRKVDQHAK
jgi:hypothetical protein